MYRNTAVAAPAACSALIHSIRQGPYRASDGCTARKQMQSMQTEVNEL